MDRPLSVGVAKSGWNLPQLQARARDSLRKREEWDKGDNYHQCPREDLVPPANEQVVRDDGPGLVMHQALDHVFDHGKECYESSK